MTKCYRDCSELPMYNFSKVLETGNYAYLLVEFDEYNKVEFNEKEMDDLWNEIYEEYCILTQNNKSLLYFSTYQELTYLKSRYEIASLLLSQLVKGVEDDFIRLKYFNALRLWKYKIDKEKPLHSELERMYKQLKQSTNKINVKQAELDALTTNEAEKRSIIQQVVDLEQALERNEIDLKKTVVAKYIALINKVKEISIARNKRNNGK